MEMEPKYKVLVMKALPVAAVVVGLLVIALVLF